MLAPGWNLIIWIIVFPYKKNTKQLLPFIISPHYTCPAPPFYAHFIYFTKIILCLSALIRAITVLFSFLLLMLLSKGGGRALWAQSYWLYLPVLEEYGLCWGHHRNNIKGRGKPMVLDAGRETRRRKLYGKIGPCQKNPHMKELCRGTFTTTSVGLGELHVTFSLMWTFRSFLL